MKPYEHETFRNAPIVEALLGIQVSTPANLTIEGLRDFQIRTGGRFPSVREAEWLRDAHPRIFWSRTLESDPSKTIGLEFRSSDHRHVIEARLDGFTFSQLRPYENWAAFKQGAQELWNIYNELAMPTRINRIGLRYINSIFIPEKAVDTKHYLRLFPEIPDDITAICSDFFMRVVFPSKDKSCNAIVILTVEEFSEHGVTLIFDIDTFSRNDEDPSPSAIWSQFDKLREFKNEIFFLSMTDKAKELFR